MTRLVLLLVLAFAGCDCNGDDAPDACVEQPTGRLCQPDGGQ